MNYNKRIISSSLLTIVSIWLIGFMAWQDATTTIGSQRRSWCANALVFGSFRFGSGGEEVEQNQEDSAEFPISITNNSKKHVHANWVDPSNPKKEVQVISDFAPGQSKTFSSHPGHRYVFYDEERSFRVVHVAKKDKASFVIREEDTKPIRAVKVQFRNQASKTINVNWISDKTSEEMSVVGGIIPNTEADVVDSYTSHHFIAFDDEHSFRVELEVDSGHAHGDLATFTITDDMIGPPKVIFVNAAEETVHVYWVDPDVDPDVDPYGSEKPVVTSLQPNHQSSPVDTHHEHIFVATDEGKTFRTQFVIAKYHGTEIFHIEGHDGVARAMTKFINMHDESIHVNYVDAKTGEEHPVVRDLEPDEESEILIAHHGHKFVAFNEARTFRRIFEHTGAVGRVELHHVVTSPSDEL